MVEAEVAGAAAECLRKLGFTRLRDPAQPPRPAARVDRARRHRRCARSRRDRRDRQARQDRPDGVARELEARGIAPEARDALLALLGERADIAQLEQQLAGHARACRRSTSCSRCSSLRQLTPAAEHCASTSRSRAASATTPAASSRSRSRTSAGSLGGGGRYDNLIGMFLGKAGAGVRLLARPRAHLGRDGRARHVSGDRCRSSTSCVAPVSDDKLRAALRLCGELRRAGLRVDCGQTRCSPGKLRKHADELRHARRSLARAGANRYASLWTRAATSRRIKTWRWALIARDDRTRGRSAHAGGEP